MSDTTTMSVYRYHDATYVGEVEVADDEFLQIESGTHPAFQWPQGLIEAGDFLTADWCKSHGIDTDETVYLTS